MNTHRLRRIALLAMAVVPIAASFASAQYRIDNSSARDANNRLGSGGYNDPSSGGRIGGLAGNYIVTGNVTQGRAFRGSLGYTDTSAFRGSVGSGAFDNFVRDSTGVGQLRGDYNRANYATIQPFFGGKTAAPPAGYVRDTSYTGGFVSRVTTSVEPNDARIDYGGASRQQLAQTYLSDQRVTGGAGLATTSGQQWSEASPQTRSLQLSEFTQLARQPRTGVFGGALTAGGVTSSDPTAATLNRPANTTAGGPNGAVPDAGDPSQRPLPDARIGAENDRKSGGASGADDRRLPSGSVLTPGRESDDSQQGNTKDAGSTGQLSTVRSSRAVDNNQQYAELRDRFATAHKQKQLPGSEANAQIQEVNAQLIKQRAGNGTAKDVKPSPAGQTANTGGGVPTGTETPAASNGNQDNGDKTAVKAMPSSPEDNIQLPRPAGDPAAAAAAQQAGGGAPMQIRSFATGVKDGKLGQQLLQAEELMRAGKFGSAIEAYDRAEEIANDDPLVFMGRSIAELGGSYYRKSELHLRQAFAGDPSLLGAKFDLRTMLTDARLNFLTTDLGEVARTNANDPGPILLLAFIYYNSGMDDRADRALDIAQQRAGGKDPVIKLLKENWNLAATGEQNK